MSRQYTYTSSKRVSKAKKRRRNSLIVLLILVFISGGTALLLLAINHSKAPPSSVPEPKVTSPSSVSLPAAASVSEPSLPEIPPATGPHDVEGLPPLYNRFYEIPAQTVSQLSGSLVPVGNGQTMETSAADAFLTMQEAAEKDGVYLSPVSGFRSNQTQTNNYNASIQNYLNQGFSQEEAVQRTEMYYAIPGTSEHEAGLAMDIGIVDDSFADTEAYQWLQQHCNEYGFIYRYPQDKTDITHIAWESWHYRYVGINHATEMQRLGFQTLEEYLAYMEGLTLQELEADGTRVNT